MDIASISTAMSMADLQTDIGIAVLSKSMDSMETMGEGMKKILESSVTPHIGGNVDVSV
jgi:hypothetical protein